VLSESVARTLGADDYLNLAFYAPDQSMVGLFVGYWGSQQHGDTIHSPLNCLPGAGWEPVSKRTLIVPVSGGDGFAPRAIGVNRYVVQKGVDRQLILYWYQSHDRAIASEYSSKWFLVMDAIRTGRTDASIVRVAVPIASEAAPGEASAENLASRFVRAVFPMIRRHLPG
jgi:EpsI family protein